MHSTVRTAVLRILYVHYSLVILTQIGIVPPYRILSTAVRTVQLSSMLDELSTLSRYVCAPLHDRSTEGSQHRPQPPCSALGGRPLSVSLRGLRKHPSTLPAAHLPHETPQDPASHRMAGASKRDGHVACSAHRTCHGPSQA